MLCYFLLYTKSNMELFTFLQHFRSYHHDFVWEFNASFIFDIKCTREFDDMKITDLSTKLNFTKDYKWKHGVYLLQM